MKTCTHNHVHTPASVLAHFVVLKHVRVDKSVLNTVALVTGLQTCRPLPPSLHSPARAAQPPTAMLHLTSSTQPSPPSFLRWPNSVNCCPSHHSWCMGMNSLVHAPHSSKDTHMPMHEKSRIHAHRPNHAGARTSVRYACIVTGSHAGQPPQHMFGHRIHAFAMLSDCSGQVDASC